MHVITVESLKTPLRILQSTRCPSFNRCPLTPSPATHHSYTYDAVGINGDGAIAYQPVLAPRLAHQRPHAFPLSQPCSVHGAHNLQRIADTDECELVQPLAARLNRLFEQVVDHFLEGPGPLNATLGI